MRQILIISFIFRPYREHYHNGSQFDTGNEKAHLPQDTNQQQHGLSDNQGRRNGGIYGVRMNPTVMLIKFTSSFFVLRIGRNVGHVISLHFFPPNLRINATASIKIFNRELVLHILAGLCCLLACQCGTGVVGQTSSPPDFNSLADDVWDIVDGKTNKLPTIPRTR